ncbi:MAG: xdhC [Myxococcaceae bacterium]|nr:xdhC [Myxococcaceae bacterium]
MSELRSLVEAARALRERGEGYFVATVVDVHGSSYRRPGARMLFTRERWLAGSVSGGCLERDVVAKGPWRTRDGRAQLVTYDGATDERSGSGCEGVIDVLVEPSGRLDLTDPILFSEHCLREERCGVLLTVFRSPHGEPPVGARYALLDDGRCATTLPSGALCKLLASYAQSALRAPQPRTETLQLAGCELLLELIVPPIHLFLFGGAHDALPVLTLAKAVGWSVTVCQRHAQLSTRERFRAADAHLSGPVEEAVGLLQRCARPAAVIMAHHYERDLEALIAVVPSKAHYVGLLGSRVRSARLLADLSARGITLDQRTRARIHAPVGLAIGAESPQEIALSIIAEVQACSAHATARAETTPALQAPIEQLEHTRSA